VSPRDVTTGHVTGNNEVDDNELTAWSTFFVPVRGSCVQVILMAALLTLLAAAAAATNAAQRCAGRLEMGQSLVS